MALALVALTIMGASEATAKRRQLSHIYMFGLAASFTDSTVYFTEIQTVDSAWIDDKTFFLENRNHTLYAVGRYGALLLCAAMLIISSILLVDATNNPFLYFRF